MGNTPIDITYRHSRIRQVAGPVLATLLLFTAALCAAPGARAQSDESWVSGKIPDSVDGTLRLRYEYEDAGAYRKDANALTLMGRAGYHFRHNKETNAYVELEGVAVGLDDYNDTTDRVGRYAWMEYPAIQDPEGYDVNQAYVSAVLPFSVHFKGGRQRIEYANGRHIGSESWRQNDRTFDAVSLSAGFLEGSDLDTIVSDLQFRYAYVFGVNQPDFEHRDVEAHLFDMDFAMWPSQKTRVGFYAYFIDDNEQLPRDLTSATLGWRYSRNYRPIDGRIKVNMEAATQGNYQEKSSYLSYPGYYDKGTRYYAISGEYWLGALGVTAGYEVFTQATRPNPALPGQTLRYAFQTPWGSNNEFNGWRDPIGPPWHSDSDYMTPQFGLRDLYAKITGNLWGTTWLLAYHRASAEDTSRGNKYGPEFNVGLRRELTRNSLVGMRFIAYDSDHLSYSDVLRATVYYETHF